VTFLQLYFFLTILSGSVKGGGGVCAGGHARRGISDDTKTGQTAQKKIAKKDNMYIKKEEKLFFMKIVDFY